ncbi:hypothetical protein [Nocardioides gilvus]|uniref:hypothetical protein n=1 Tax=Nocardioides gilvus TaxID=1735589 RepID=UPI000D7501CB|nr:hypothetical protein [Nocardioides gilvus]
MIDTRTPHVERAWAEALLLELRLRGVAGTMIGAVLAEVEAHCADSGETARDAFGDPKDYAAALDLPESVLQDGSSLRDIAVPAVGLLGMFSTIGSVAAWQTGTTVSVTLGAALGALVLVICFAVLALRTTNVLRFMIHHPLVTILGLGAFTGGAVALFVSARQSLFDLPWQPLLALGLLLVLAEFIWNVRHRGELEDPVVGPGPDGAGTLQVTRLDRLASAVGPWLTPALTAALSLPWLFV